MFLIRCLMLHVNCPVYSVVLDSARNQACSGSMDSTVRVWNLQTGECQHTLTGHASLVGLLGLSPSYLVSAAADSTLRIWDPDTGELRNTLAAHTGAITCFQHDEFKVLSGSDGTLKMWDVRDGTIVRDLLTGIIGVWQVVFEGRWCVAASNRQDATVLDVWDFGDGEEDDDWIGEPAGGIYDEDETEDEEDEDEEMEQADVDAMDQDLDVAPSEAEMGDGEEEYGMDGDGYAEEEVEDELPTVHSTERSGRAWDEHAVQRSASGSRASSFTHHAGSSRSPPYASGSGTSRRSGPTSTNTLMTRISRGGVQHQTMVGPLGRAGASSSSGAAAGSSSSTTRARALPTNDETPTRPRIRPSGSRKR